MKTGLLAIAAVLALVPLASGQRVETDNSSVLVVTGESQIRVAPDQATVRIGISRQAATAQAVQDQVNSVANDLLSAITKVGIPSTDIQTSRLTLTPVYAGRNDSNQPRRIAAYQAANIISVRITDLAKIGAVIDAGLGSGSNEIQGVQFGLRDDLPARQQALKQAVSEAQKKAETIADAARVQLGPPLEISENGTSAIPRGDFQAMGMLSARAAEAPTPVSPGEMEVHATVTIRYRITPKR